MLSYELACRLLGIEESAKITLRLLKSNFRKLSLLCHPDKIWLSEKNKLPELLQKFPRKDQFLQLSNAYTYLLKELDNTSKLRNVAVEIKFPTDFNLENKSKSFNIWQAFDLGECICIICRCNFENFIESFNFDTFYPCQGCSILYTIISG